MSLDPEFNFDRGDFQANDAPHQPNVEDNYIDNCFRAHIFVEGKVKDNIIVQCGVPDTKLAKGARRARIRRLLFKMWSCSKKSIIRLIQEEAVDMHDFKVELQIHANIVNNHNAYVDGKTKGADNGGADAFFNDNPGLRPLKVNRMLLRSEVNRLKGLKVDEPTIPIIANPGEVPVDELSYALMPKKEQIAFWHKLGSLVAAQFHRPLRSFIDVYVMLMDVFRTRFMMFMFGESCVLAWKYIIAPERTRDFFKHSLNNAYFRHAEYFKKDT
ncbi:hypothetical protein LTS10_003627 [Elasticomyces elasticus]|nr:hypothetical protein LTS10_003627 [Elasticomyces elasticus]